MSEYQDFWFHSHDGLRLYARDYSRPQVQEHGKEDTRGDPCNTKRPTVICIPGLTRNSADFAQLSRHLSKRFRVIAVDLRGRGRSDYDSNPENYHPGVYVRDMLQLMDALAQDRVILIGSSLGGLISIILAATVPRRIAAVVLNDIGPEVERAGLDRIKSYVRSPGKVENWQEAAARTQAIHGSAFPDFDHREWLEFARNLYREEADGRPVLAYDPAIAVLMTRGKEEGNRADLWPVFEAIPAIPFMLVRGVLSDIITPQVVDRMRHVMPGIRIVEVANRGHAPLLTENVCLQGIDAFVEALLKPPVDKSAT